MSATPSRRQSSQPHPQSAQSRRRNATQASVLDVTPLPEYQTPEAPLTAESQRRIAALLASHHLRTLRTHLQHAAEKLTHSGGEVNERLSDARVRYEKAKEVRRSEGDENVDDDESSEEYQRLAEAEARVDAITARMEEKTRLIVDSEVKLQGLTDAIGQIEREEGENVATALGVRQTRQQRARQRANAVDEDDGTEDPTDGDYEDEQEKEMRERNAANPPSRKLVDKLTEGVQQWDELSLTERYASNNSYIGFYRMVHDAKFPGDDVPPLPHSSTWFEHMEDTTTRSGVQTRTRNQNRAVSPGSDDDIAIERERISLKCPLTLTSYQDPVTSTKCPHSFEREAIMDMINRSQTTIPPPASRRGQRRVRVVKCPVCSTPLTADDFRPDPVLLRRVRRAQELQKREEEDDHLEGDGRKQKDRSTGITLGSDGESDDDAMDVDAQPTSQRVKMEPLSQPAPVQSDESGDDAESLDAEIEDAENGDGESEEGEDEEVETEQQNEPVDIEQPHSGEPNEVEMDDPDNEAENEDGEIEHAQIEEAQNEEQNEEMETNNSDNEGGSEEVPDETQNEEQNDEIHIEVENADVESDVQKVASQDVQPDVQGEGQDKDDSDSGESTSTDSEDSDIEPKVESGSEDSVESVESESD